MSEKSINTRKINTRKIITWEINTGEIDVSEISAGITTKKGGKPMKPDKKFPLFIVSGASGVGKSTMCEILFKKETDYIVLESDILWQEVCNTPQDNYRNFREVWMTMCANVSQIGMPVVLCGCGIPEQFEICDARKYFTQIHYLAVVCETPILEKRMREGRGIQEEDWIRSSVSFNLWLRENASKTQPQITLLDNTNLTPEEAAEEADKWIRKQGW